MELANQILSGGELQFVIGIDEAGRGPLAGPLVVAGVRMRREASGRRQEARGEILRGIKDSKRLTAKQREEWYARLTRCPDIEWATAVISPSVIDRINIYQTAQRGARRVYKKLAGCDPCHALLDGSLHLPSGISHETIVKGDELVPIISAASVIAKVTRDRMMIRLHKKYPEYRFDLHKGYGTELHRRMIAEYGRCALHRRSFRCL